MELSRMRLRQGLYATGVRGEEPERKVYRTVFCDFARPSKPHQSCVDIQRAGRDEGERGLG